MKYTKEIITERLDFITSKLKEEIIFRKGQKETVIDICYSVLNKLHENVLLSAPTGSGKSCIAIFTSAVLVSFGKSGYIITSNLDLQDQYSKDFKKYGFTWGTVKGIDNYICSVNGESYSIGDCKNKSMKAQQIVNLPCYENCGYLQARNRAIKSRVSLLNYSYWILQRNYVAERGKEIFEKRDFCIFDEAHKVEEIVQNHFSPQISSVTLDKITQIYQFLQSNFPFSLEKIIEPEIIDQLFWNLHSEENEEKLLELLTQIFACGATYGASKTIIKDYIRDVFKEEDIPKDWLRILRCYDFLKDVLCKIEDYLEIAKEFGANILVKNMTEDSVTFNILNTKLLLKKRFLQQAESKIHMSATFGDVDEYSFKVIDVKNYQKIEMDNLFNFEKSPIFLFKDSGKMSYHYKKESFPKNLQLVDEIVNIHKNSKGIIHSNSYDFTDYILTNSVWKNRLISYKSSSEKGAALEKMQKRKDGILIGPSLLEGLDLKDDMSRFQIFLKVPYPNLANNYISKKMKYDQNWYNWHTTIKILQGIGRSIRNTEDYAITYLIDACFNEFISKNKEFLGDNFRKRLKLAEKAQIPLLEKYINNFSEINN